MFSNITVIITVLVVAAFALILVAYFTGDATLDRREGAAEPIIVTPSLTQALALAGLAPERGGWAHGCDPGTALARDCADCAAPAGVSCRAAGYHDYSRLTITPGRYAHESRLKAVMTTGEFRAVTA